MDTHQIYQLAGHLLDLVPSMVMVVDWPTRQVIYKNQGAAYFFNLLDMESGWSDLSRFEAVIYPEDLKNFKIKCASLQNFDQANWDMRVQKQEGNCRWVQCQASLLNRLPDGFPAKVMIHFTDITENKFKEDVLNYRSSHDALTGLYNRNFFDEEVQRLEKGRNYPIGIVMIDVDGLKKANDTLGHSAGDALLIRVAQVLQPVFRGEDIVARIGGDEFAVILPGVDQQIIEDTISRIRAELVEHNYGHKIPLSISIGFALAHKNQPVKDVIKAADEMMYAEKFSRVSRESNKLEFA